MPVTWKAGSSVIQLHKGTEKILKSKLGTLILPILGITADFFLQQYSFVFSAFLATCSSRLLRLSRYKRLRDSKYL